MDPVSGGLAAAGILGEMGNKKSKNASARASNKAGDLLKKQGKVYDYLTGYINDLTKSGILGIGSADKTIADLNKYSYEDQARDSANVAGEAKILGYRPGDTEPGVRSRALAVRYQADRDRMRTGLKADEPYSVLKAYGMANPNYGGVAQGYQQQAQVLGQQQTDTSGIWGGLAQRMMPKPGEKEPQFSGRPGVFVQPYKRY